MNNKNNTLTNFFKIPHKEFAIHIHNEEQLNDLVNKFKALGYDYGTGDTDIEQIKLVQYFGGFNNCYISIDKECTYHPRPYVCLGKSPDEKVYEFDDIDWRI